VKYAWIERHRKHWPVSLACEVLGVSPSGYHEHKVRSAKPRRNISDDALLEIKVRSWPGNAWGEDGTDEIPPDVKSQVEHYLAVTGLPVAHIAVLFRGARLGMYVVRANPMLADLTAEEGEWWQRHVVEGEQPAWDGSPGASAALRAWHPRDNGESLSIVALPHQSPVLEEFASVRQQQEAHAWMDEGMDALHPDPGGIARAQREAAGLVLRARGLDPDAVAAERHRRRNGAHAGQRRQTQA